MTTTCPCGIAVSYPLAACDRCKRNGCAVCIRPGPSYRKIRRRWLCADCDRIECREARAKDKRRTAKP